MKTGLFTTLLLLVAGCGANAASADGGDALAGAAWSYVYACEDDYAFSVRFVEDAAVLVLDGRRVELPQAISASGARYATADFEFWGKGDEATLQTPSIRRTECEASPAASPWEDAALRGVAFRGVGQEPGWYVELMPEHSLLFVGDYGETVVEATASAVRRDDVMKQSQYTAQTDDGTLFVWIDDAPCIDTMSGEAFPARARVQLRDRLFIGCGRWLAD